jgi:hypothetical protein
MEIYFYQNLKTRSRNVESRREDKEELSNSGNKW